MDGADGDFRRGHPLIDDSAELRHFHQAAAGTSCGVHILLDRSQLGLGVLIGVLHTIDAAEHFGEIERLNRNPVRFENLFAVANGVESRGTRANCADAQIAEAVHHAADAGEPLQVFGELRRVGAFGVQCRNRIRNAVLVQVVARRHLSAEAVAAERDRHLVGIVGRRLNQNRNAEIGEAQRVGDGALFAEVGQRDNDAVNAVAILLEQIRAAARFFAGFHRAVLAFFGSKRNDVDARRLRAREASLRGRSWPDDRGRTRGCPRSAPSSFCCLT